MHRQCSAVVWLQELSTDELVQVLVTPKNALAKQYARMFQLNSTRLHVTPKALQAIAVIAKEKGTGARGLRSIMERLLNNAMFEVSTSCSRRPRNVLTSASAEVPACVCVKHLSRIGRTQRADVAFIAKQVEQCLYTLSVLEVISDVSLCSRTCWPSC